jgi:hypothetical protein
LVSPPALGCAFVRTVEAGSPLFIQMGEIGAFSLVGLSGDTLLKVPELTLLVDSFVFTEALEKTECIELTNVLELLPGSLPKAGLMGVDGLTGRGTRLLLRKFGMSPPFPPPPPPPLNIA